MEFLEIHLTTHHDSGSQPPRPRYCAACATALHALPLAQHWQRALICSALRLALCTHKTKRTGRSPPASQATSTQRSTHTHTRAHTHTHTHTTRRAHDLQLYCPAAPLFQDGRSTLESDQVDERCDVGSTQQPPYCCGMHAQPPHSAHREKCHTTAQHDAYGTL